MTQQAASKSVADLERRGYAARAPDPVDARARLAVLTERSEAAIEGGRRHRAAVAAERPGPRRVEGARRLLIDVGGEPAVCARRVRAPR